MNIIYDYGLRNTIPTDDIVKDKHRNLCVGDVGHGNSFNPLGKVLSHSDNELMAIR